MGIALAPAARAVPFAYVANRGPTITVVDTQGHTVRKTITLEGPLGVGPVGIAVNPTGTRVYATNHAIPGLIWVIDAASNEVVDTIDVGNDAPFALAISPDGIRGYVTQQTHVPGIVGVLDLTADTVIDRIEVGGNPTGIAVTPDGSRVYVATLGCDIPNNDLCNPAVTVISAATNAVTRTIPVPGAPAAVVIDKSGSTVYVRNGSVATVIDAATETVTGAIPVAGAQADSLALHPSGSTLYGSDALTDSVYAVDVNAPESPTIIPVGPQPRGLAIHPTGKFLYATEVTTQTLVVINTATKEVVDTVPAGPGSLGQFVGPACPQFRTSATIRIHAPLTLATRKPGASMNCCKTVRPAWTATSATGPSRVSLDTAHRAQVSTATTTTAAPTTHVELRRDACT